VTADPLAAFGAVWFVDFEFYQPDGERPSALCMVAREWRTGETIRLWRDHLVRRGVAPIPVGPDALFVAYYASAEFGCFLSLGWPLPIRILDLYAEFKCLTSGLPVPCGYGLLGALTQYGLDGIDATDKGAMRELAMRGGPYSNDEQMALVDYCETDVVALNRLLPKMLPEIDLPRALLRGRYMAAVARMEATGTPIDVETLHRIRDEWGRIQRDLVRTVDKEFGVYAPTGREIKPAEGPKPKHDRQLNHPAAELAERYGECIGPRPFSAERFAAYLIRENIPWPQLPSGALALDDDTFRQMAKGYPQIAPLRELRHSLSKLRLESLAVGKDGRNRCLLSAYASKTGRNQPSNARYIFGPSVWLRSLIRPSRGMALAYVDWSQQEFGIAAALSGDAAMKEAYTSGDPYLEFAKQAGAVPANATKESHGDIREQFKVCSLAVQYGMAEKSLAERLGVCEGRARELLRFHRETYPTFWRWSQAAVDHALLGGWLQTVFGWRVHVGPAVNPRSLANFPMQANGAEMLRLACCLATERGIQVCGPVHDALLIESRIDRIDDAAAECQAAMREASEVVLDGFGLRTDCRIVRWPDRYVDPRGVRFWETVLSLLDDPQPLRLDAHLPLGTCAPAMHT
jgi:hypothetical protein